MRNGSKPGYLVRAVLRRGAASKHGIEIGDTVTSVAGKPVNARGALGRILSGYKRGALVNVHLTKLDGRKVVKRVTLGGKKGSRGALGIISGKKASRAYNAKLEARKDKVESKPAAPKKVGFFSRKPKAPKKAVAVKAVAVNPLRKKANDELALLEASMEDRLAADDLMSAKKLRAKLESDNKRRLRENQDAVSEYLTALSREKKAEVEKAMSDVGVEPKKMSAFAKLIIAVGSLGAVSTVAAVAYNYFII